MNPESITPPAAEPAPLSITEDTPPVSFAGNSAAKRPAWLPEKIPSMRANEKATIGRLKFVLAALAGMASLAAGLCGFLLSSSLWPLLPGLLGVMCSALLLWQKTHKSEGASAREALLLEAFHSVLTPQLITDDTGKTLMANEAYQGWMQEAAGQGEEALAARFAGRSQSAAEFQRLRRNVRTGQVAIAELPILQEGRLREWRRVMARQLSAWPGHVYWRLDDITERRRIEQAMRDEQAKLMDFMTHAPVGIYSADQQGRFRFVNRTLAEWLGTTPEELVNGGVRLHDLLHEPLPGTAAHGFTPGPEGDVRADVMMRGLQGRLFPVSITQTIVMQEDGKALRTRSVVRDLAPERAWQEALTLSEHRFQRLFAQSPIGVVLVDAELRLLETNQAFLQLLARPSAEILGKTLIGLFLPEQQAAMMSGLRQVLGGRELEKPIEARLQRKGDPVSVQLYARSFSVQSHQADEASGAGLMIYVIDFSEQKKLEAQFAQSQKMQAIGQLAGGIAHDFNNLLTAMLGYCDLLLQRHKPGDHSFADIMQIKQNASRAANLVRQLLAFSRQQALQPRVLHVTDVLAELTNLLRRLIGSNIELQMQHGRDLYPVKVDEGQLEQVIINLVVNARDAMAQGGALQIRTRNVQTAQPQPCGQDEMPPGDYVVIEVEDSGHGIPPEIIQRIFEPFFSTKEVGQGTGLGLSTVYGIVRQTGGYVDVESRPQQGTLFAIYLPRHAEIAKSQRAALAGNAASREERDDGGSGDISHEVRAEMRAGRADAKNTGNAREEKAADLTGAASILLVEDEDAVRMFSARALRNKGYTVIEARSGEEALQLLGTEAQSVELLISDVVMPQMDGPTLIRKVRETHPNLRVIFISGYTEDRFRDQLREGEVVHFLGKPFTLKQLASKVKEVLSEEGIAGSV